MRYKYNLIYSIGTDCACAIYMRKNKLRSYSGPFDWLTGADFKTRLGLMNNEFEFFLNIEDLCFLPKNPHNILNDGKCDNYRNIKNNFFYFHDFSKDIPLENSFPVVKEKYNRRIKRFYDEIKKQEKVLLIWFAHNWETSDDLVLQLTSDFIKKMDKEIDFLIIEHDENKKKGDIEKIILNKNITRYKLFTRATDAQGNSITQGDKENCNKIFSQYKLIAPFRRIVLNKSRQLLVELVCCFIPTRKYRKVFRKKFKNPYRN